VQKEIENYLKGIEMPKKANKPTTLKYCNICESVWEYWHQTGDFFFRKYTDIPTYGLDRKDCRECVGLELSKNRKKSYV